MRSALVAAILLFATGSSWAFDTGNEFLKECEPGTKKAFTQLSDQEQLWGSACANYIRGFVGGVRVAEAATATKMICSPPGVEVLQAMRISVQWMSEHTEQLEKSAAQLIFTSLVDAFPCSERTVPPEKSEEKDRLKL